MKEIPQNILDRMKNEMAERHINMLKAFENMRPFTCVDDIPSLPRLKDKIQYEDVVVKNLIRCGAIPKKDLEVGATYEGSCRNAYEAIWNGEKFTYKRTKFGYTYDEDINHFEDDDGYDLFVPLKKKN